MAASHQHDVCSTPAISDYRVYHVIGTISSISSSSIVFYTITDMQDTMSTGIIVSSSVIHTLVMCYPIKDGRITIS